MTRFKGPANSDATNFSKLCHNTAIYIVELFAEIGSSHLPALEVHVIM